MRQSAVSSRQWWPVALLCAIVIATYGNSFGTGFAFDSRQLILQDARVHAATADNVRAILQHTYWWPYGESGLYRPITTFTYLLNYAVVGAGERAWPYHAVNLLLHLCNVLLVWALVRRVYIEGWGRGHLRPSSVPTFRYTDVAFAAAAIWGVVPLSVEAVTNIVGRADLLATCGVLTGLLAYRRSWIGLAAATLLAVGSKESGIVIVPLVIAYELTRWDPKTSRRMLMLAAAAMALPLVIWWTARSVVLNAAPAAEFAFIDNPIVGASWIVGRLTALKAAGLYIWKLAWPATLSADYSFDAIPLARGSITDWLAWLTVAACLAGIVAASLRSRHVAFFGALAMVAFLPVSNLLFATGTIFGERLMYLPSVGLVALAALALARLPRLTFISVISLVIVTFANHTWARNPAWTDDVTLWRAAVTAEPSSAKAHHALALAMYDADPSHGNLDTVIAEQERAAAILADVPSDKNAFVVFRQAGAYHLDKAQQLAAEGQPEFARALTLLQRAAAIDAAGARARETSNTNANADVNRLLASAYLGVHDAEHAIEAATRARDLDPLSPLPYRQIATAQLAREDADAAAVTLMAGSMVTADRGLTQALLGLYAAGLDEHDCAAAAGQAGPTLNTSCDVVQRHLCAAAPETARLDRQLGRFTEAERVEATARTMTGCR
jgi:hypothetical protein